MSQVVTMTLNLRRGHIGKYKETNKNEFNGVIITSIIA